MENHKCFPFCSEQDQNESEEDVEENFHIKINFDVTIGSENVEKSVDMTSAQKELSYLKEELNIWERLFQE